MANSAETIVPGRDCGTCSYCCKLPLITELAKPVDTWCTNCRPGRGCAIYGDRPAVCREFHCGWLTEPGIGEEWRPTQSKMMIIMDHTENRVSVLVDPQRADAWRKAPYYQQLKRWAAGAVASGGHIHVCIGSRTVVILPDRDVDLGEVGPNEVILTRKRTTSVGLAMEVLKLAKDDPQVREVAG